MNTPPPDDMKRTYNGTMPTVADSEKAIESDAPAARNAIARRFPGEAGKSETDTGKTLWEMLGIGKKR